LGIKNSYSYLKEFEADMVGRLDFPEFRIDEKPNVFQIRNLSLTEVLYVSSRPDLSVSNFDVSVVPAGTRVLTLPEGSINGLYFLIGETKNVRVNAFYSTELMPTDLDQNQTSIIVNYQAVPSTKLTDGDDVLAINSNGSINAVVVLPELPAGNNNIGNVDVVTLPPDYDHEKIHTGNAFYIQHKFTGIASSGNAFLQIKTTEEIHLRVDDLISDKSNIDVGLFEAPTLTNGTTVVNAINANFSSIKTLGASIFNNPVITNDGTFKRQFFIAGTNQSVNPTSSPRETILKSNTDYLIKITNNNASVADLLVSLFAYN
jgi:hypothetical protein